MSAESPIAHRTRGAGSYEDAAINHMCKLCSTRLTSMDDLWIHLRDSHRNEPAKRAKAMEAFPIAFQLDRLADCLPSMRCVQRPLLHSPCALLPTWKPESWSQQELMTIWATAQSLLRRTTRTCLQTNNPAMSWVRTARC
ncbi:hypothetical protein TNCV_2504151 [Trichonephila clavipes]|nr:hypothetical protein TNCV_2504151 [Trichonephila clavipes]